LKSQVTIEFKDIFSTKINKLVNQIASSYESIQGLINTNKRDLARLEHTIDHINEIQIQNFI